MKKLLSTILIIVFSILFIVSSLFYLNDLRVGYLNKQLYKKLSSEVEKTDEKDRQIDNSDSKNITVTPAPKKKDHTSLQKYQKLYKENTDLVGWLKIGNIIDYPVMMNKEDSDYYLHRDFYKRDNRYGCIYINNECRLNSKSSISLIYGHCMRDGSMFSGLRRYLNKDFFEKNKIIELDSLNEESQYEVVGAFLSKIYRQDELSVFKYYDYKGKLTREDFNDYINGVSHLLKIGELSGVKYGDSLVELVTCNYHTKNGKLVVLCKKIKK